MQRKGGFIWHGVFTNLVPVRQLNDSAILWHIKKSYNNDYSQVKNIQALQSVWFQNMDIRVYQTAPEIVGWSYTGDIHLASRSNSSTTT